MKRLPLLVGALLITINTLLAQENNFATKGDSTIVVQLRPVDVNTGRNWSNDTIRYRYNQMKYYVTTILPYLNAATAMMNELNTKEQQPGISKRELKAFVNVKEEEIHKRFDEEVSKLNETQGVLLIKLVARQTGANIYSKLEEYKTTFYAIKWQTWARFHGFNLNRRYDPDDEPMLEHIMQGLGYPLPACYGEREPAQLTIY